MQYSYSETLKYLVQNIDDVTGAIRRPAIARPNDGRIKQRLNQVNTNDYPTNFY